MSDIYDQATDQEMMIRELAIKSVRSRNIPFRFTGHCLHCSEHIDQGRFCNSECREDHEKEHRLLKVSGRLK